MHKTSLRVFLIVSILCVSLLVVGGIMGVGSSRLNSRVQHVNAVELPRLALIYDVKDRADQIQRLALTHLLSNNPADMRVIEDSISEMYAQNLRAFDTLIARTEEDTEKEKAVLARDKLRCYAQIRRLTLSLSRAGLNDRLLKDSAMIVNRNQQLPAFLQFRQVMTVLADHIQREAVDDARQASDTAALASAIAWISMLLSFALIVLIGLAAWRTTRQIDADYSRFTETQAAHDALQRELHIQYADFQGLIQSAPEAVAILNAQGMILHINPEFSTLFGYEPHEALGQDIDRLVVRENRGDAVDLTHQALNGARVTADAIRYRKDSTEVNVSILAVPTRLTDGTDGIHVIYRDITTQKQNEAALRNSEEQLRAMFEHAPDAYYLHDLAGTFIDGNKAAEEMTGYPREELIGKNFLKTKMLAKRDLGRAALQLARNAMGEPTGPIEFELRRKDGSSVCAEIRSYPVKIRGKSVVLGIARDITARRVAERELRDNEEKFRALFDNANDGIIILENGRVVECNQSVERIFERPKKDLIGSAFPSLLAAKDATTERSSRTLQEALDRAQSGQRPSLEGVGQRPNGTTFDCEISLASFRMQKRTIVQAYIRDVTSRKSMERKLIQLSTAVDQSPAIVMITDAAGIIEYVNPAFTDITGYSAEEARGDNPRFLKSGTMAPEVYAQLWAAITNGEVWHGRLCNRRKSGELYWEEASIAPLRDANGLTTGFIGVKTDISERMRIEAELIQSKETAVAALKAKSDFLAMMSHEIRTPMNGVIGMTGLLAETQLTDEQHDYVETIRTSGDALLTIINDILDYSKIESGKLDLENHTFSVRDSVESVLELLAPKAAQKDIDLICNIDPNVPAHVCGDSTRVRQVIMNLVGNGIKFTEKGEVEVHVRVQERSEDNLRIAFDVRDTGIGIPEDKMNRLFQSFTQVDSSTTRKYGGTGLGLVICSKLVRLMGGMIEVESRVDIGTVFRFTVLVRESVSLQSHATAHHHLRGKRVLIADDNSANRTILVNQTRRWGMDAHAVEDGPGALAYLNDHAVDLLILDMQMPGMDGAMVASEIRGQSQFADLPIILLTSMGKPEETYRDLFNACVTKPVRQSVLQEVLLKAMGSSTPRVTRQKAAGILDPELSSKLPTRILIAEDNVINQKIAVHAFGKMGYSVDIVGNGLEAVTAANQVPYDLIFMDVQMPEMDGLEATRTIRKHHGRGVVIIAMTANAMSDDQNACMEAGMDDYITKPVKPILLQEKIKQWREPMPADSRIAS